MSVPTIPAEAGSTHGPWVRRRNGSEHPRTSGEHNVTIVERVRNRQSTDAESSEGVIAS